MEVVVGNGGGSEFGFAPQVWSILPPDEGELDLTEFEPIVCAQEDMENLPFGTKEEEINVVIDEEIEDQCVEIIGLSANIGFAIGEMELPLLVLHIKSLNRYLRFEITLRSTERERFKVKFTNHQSLVRVKNNTASLPIKLDVGWNRLCIDLRKICKHGFGVEFKACTSVRVFANCRIWRLFFQGRDYADEQLPPHLRVIEAL